MDVKRILLIAGLIAGCSLLMAQEVILITDRNSPDYGCVVVNGLDLSKVADTDSLEHILNVYPQLDVQAKEDYRQPPMLGNYRAQNGTLLFTPRLSLIHGRQYRAEVWFAGKHSKHSFLVPKLEASTPRPKVTGIYPSSAQIPANILKFYIEFSAPVVEGQGLDHIYLVDGSGQKIPGSFADLGNELWDPDRKRLTVWMHPGGFKKGLMPQPEQGPILTEGTTCKLVIDEGWRSSQLAEPGERFEQTYRVIAPDQEKPDPNLWNINPPKTRSGYLTAVFPEPLDRALLASKVTILMKSGARVEGKFMIAKEERAFRFKPKRPWAPGEYRVLVHADLEDLAGNNVNRLFDADLTLEMVAGKKVDFVEIAFSVN